MNLCLIYYISVLIRNVGGWVKIINQTDYYRPIVISSKYRVEGVGMSGRQSQLFPSNPLSTITCTSRSNYELVSGLTLLANYTDDHQIHTMPRPFSPGGSRVCV